MSNVIDQFPVELVFPGHPDKICDTISDRVLDSVCVVDRDARVAIETMIKNDLVVVTGEVSSSLSESALEDIVQDAVDTTLASVKLDPSHFRRIVEISTQSPQIASSVNSGLAGDQAVCIGFAGDPAYGHLPANMFLAKAIRDKLINDFRSDPRFMMDGKILVRHDGVVIVSIQHTGEEHGDVIREHVKGLLPDWMDVYVNIHSDFVFGGSFADAGLTGRKIVADAYGPAIPVGGGAFSGKDLSKVDRAGAILARNLAVALVTRNSMPAYFTTVLSYAFGVKDPVSVQVISHGKLAPGVVDEVTERMDLSVDAFKGMMYGHSTNWTFTNWAIHGQF